MAGKCAIIHTKATANLPTASMHLQWLKNLSKSLGTFVEYVHTAQDSCCTLRPHMYTFVLDKIEYNEAIILTRGIWF